MVEAPRLHVASPVNVLPTYFVSSLLHIPAIMPVDIRIMSCCSDASRQIALFCGGRSLFRLLDVVISHRPDFSFGYSGAACAPSGKTKTSMSSVRNMRKLRSGMAVAVLDRHHIDEFVDRHCFELLQVERDVENRVLLLGGKAARKIGFELLDQQRHAFLAPAPMSNRIFDHHFARAAAIGEFDRDGV